ncbi:MAG TPA: amidohydrolase family protein [Myxococcales bacterium]
MALWITGARNRQALCVEGGRIAAEARRPPQGSETLDAGGLLLLPAFIDAHVHLSLLARAPRAFLKNGVAAVLDLGAPERALPFSEAEPLRVRFSGPLLTAPRGYPTQSWGRDGYGLEVASEKEARAAVERLALSGARFLKLAFDPRYPLLAPEAARAAADEAHRRGMLVAAHALDADSVRRALAAGADVFAHAPLEAVPLPGKWVISTLRAFGGTVRGLGARVVYGTDLGNEDTSPAIDARELALLERDGIDPLRAATADAAELLGYPDLGRLSVGSSASLLAVRGLDAESLANPAWVMNCGTLCL